MRFNEQEIEDKQMILNESLTRYKEEKVMTLSEESDLHKWVVAGNDPYCNGYGYCFENGRQMNYVEAERVNLELNEQNETILTK